MQPSVELETATVIKYQQATGLSFVVGFFFAVRIIVVLLSVRLLGMAPREGAEMDLGLGALILVFVSFQYVGQPHRSFRSIVRLSSIRWATLFLAVSFCSLAWSATISPSTSIAYWCGMAMNVAIVVLIVRSASLIVASNSLLRGYVSGACCLALVAWLMPAQADLRLGDEEFFNANQIGNLCAIAIFLAQYLIRRNAGRWGGAIFLLALTLLRSLSKTTIVAFLISEGFLLIADRSIRRQTKVLLTLALCLSILVFWGLFEAYYNVYTSAGNQAETFTGRTGIWAYALDAALQQPLLGHGFDSMWKVAPPFGPDRFEARHAENEFLQQFYAYGILGVCLVIGVYGSLFRQMRRIKLKPLKIVSLSLLLFVVVRGLAEAEAFDLLLPLWLIVLLSLLIEQLNGVIDPATGSRLAQKSDTSIALQPVAE